MPRSFLFLLVPLLVSACQPGLNPEQRATRLEVRQALIAHSFARAEELAHRAVEFSPRENDAWDDLVQAQIGQRNFTAARKTLEEWHAAIPNQSPKWWELTGDVALAEQNPSRALACWTKTLGPRPAAVRVLRKIARLHERERRWTEENETLTTLIAIEDNATDRSDRALTRRRLRRWPEALDDLHRAQELEPKAPDVREATQLFDRVGKFLAAIRDLDARLAITAGDDQLLADRALLFLRSGDPELALADATAAGKLAPWAMRPRLFNGLALIALGRAVECAELGVDSRIGLSALTPEFLETISRLDSEMSLERTSADLYVTRAWQLNDIGQPTLALQDAGNALRFDADSAGAHAECAYALTKLDRKDEAFAHIKRATELDENFSTAWHYRGELEMSRGDLNAAVESLSRALAINQTAAALQKREDCYRKLGQLQQAETDHHALEALR